MTQPWLEWLDGVGTYVKVVWNPSSEALIVLYLRPKGLFLFAGYWDGFEYSLAAGRWRKDEHQIFLDGRGRLQTDTVPGPEGGKFDRVFTIDNATHTPALTAAVELKGWSLLGWTGPFVYVGRRTVIDPDEKWLPASMPAVDMRIAELLEASR